MDKNQELKNSEGIEKGVERTIQSELSTEPYAPAVTTMNYRYPQQGGLAQFIKLIYNRQARG